MTHLDPVQIAGYIDRRLSLAERNQVEAHLEGCPACIQCLADAARTLAELREVHPQYFPEDPPTLTEILDLVRDE